MRRSALILLVAGMLGLGVFLATRKNDSGAPAPAPEPRDGLVESPRELDTTTASVPSNDRTVVEALDGEAVREIGASAGWRVCVVDASTDAPVVDATVTVLDLAVAMRAIHERNIGFDSIEGLRVRQQTAAEARSGADGCVFIPAPPESAMVEARSGANWAFTTVGQVPDDRCVTLRIAPDRMLRVRVVDAAGTPVGRVPVALRRWSETQRAYDSKWTDTDAETGIATFLHFQRRLAQGAGWHAMFAFPVRDEPRIPVDASTPLDPPITLVLPDTGRLRIRVRAADGSVPELGDAELRIDAFEGAPGRERLWPDGPWSHPRLDAQAEALVPWIGLGLQVTATLVRDEVGLAVKSTAGPTHAGEEVVCDLEWLEAAPHFVTGRFVLSDGRAWPAATVEAQPWIFPTPSPWPAARELRVEADGRFRLQVDEARHENGSRAYRFAAPHPDGSGKVSALVALDLEIPAQGLDLGDVLLDYGVLLASGRVVDTAHRPIAGASFSVGVRTVVHDDEMWPILHTSGTLRSGDDGTFDVHLQPGESLTSDQLRLDTTADGYVTDRRSVIRGDRDIEVVLRRAGALAGSLALDSGLAREDVALFLLGETWQNVALLNDATFELRDLIPSTYSLEVRRRGANGRFERAPAARVDGLVVRAGETCRDPRIQALRIESVLSTLKIRVVDSVAMPLKNAAVSIVGRAEARATMSGDDGVCLVRCDALPVDLDVSAFGYLRQRLVNVSEDRDVALDAGFPIRLHTSAPPSGGEPQYLLGATLYTVDANGLRRGPAWGAEYTTAYTTERSHFDRHGELALRMPEAGVYECEVHVTVLAEHVGRGASVELAPNPRITVLAGRAEQVFELAISREAISAAIERALR